MGCSRSTARVAAIGLVILAASVAIAQRGTEMELAGPELVVTRVERGRFPAVKLWLTPSSTVEVDPVHGGELTRVYAATPAFERSGRGTVTNFANPRNIRNVAAYYLEPGDRLYCEKAFRQPKTNVWVLDGIRRIPPERPATTTGRTRVVAGTPKSEDTLRVRILTDKKAYQAGETVRLTLRAQNRGSKPMTLVFPQGETHLVMISSAMAEAWRYTAIDPVTSRGDARRTLKPGETLELAAAWDQKTQAGQMAAPGRYSAAGKVMSEGRTILEPARTSFMILPARD